MKYILIILLLTITNIAVAAPQPGFEVSKESSAVEYKKKAMYYKIKADLEEEKIAIKTAQRLWAKHLNKLRKEEGK